MHIAELERTLKSGDYVCDICSYSGVYGFVIYTNTDVIYTNTDVIYTNTDVIYTNTDDVRKLVSWDFGYYGRELAESSALACILRRTLGVSVKDYTTVFNDSASDCD